MDKIPRWDVPAAIPYSQLSNSREQFWVSRGKLLKSMEQSAVTVILKHSGSFMTVHRNVTATDDTNCWLCNNSLYAWQTRAETAVCADTMLPTSVLIWWRITDRMVFQTLVSGGFTHKSALSGKSSCFLPDAVEDVAIRIHPQHDVLHGCVVDERALGVDKEHVGNPDLLDQTCVKGAALVAAGGEGQAVVLPVVPQVQRHGEVLETNRTCSEIRDTRWTRGISAPRTMFTSDMLSMLSTCTSIPTGRAEPTKGQTLSKHRHPPWILRLHIRQRLRLCKSSCGAMT